VLVVTPAPPPPERRPNFRERDKIRRREARRQRYDEVLELVRQGVSGRGIERRLGISRETVRRYVQAGAFPEIASRAKGPSILDPFRPYLEQRWDEGCRKGQVLLQELQARGYRGGNTLVAGAIAELRRATKALAIPTVAPAKKKAPPPRPLAPRSVRWWFARDPDDLTAEEKRDLNHVCTRCAEAQAVYELAQRFGRMVRERRPEDLAAWLDDARSGPRELRTLAGGLERDRAAVEAALTLEWSNGQTEGQINRLKLIKRKAFGRANFDLLRQRVLEAA
jgi:transposase